MELMSITKKTRELIYKIPKPIESHEHAVLAQSIAGIAKDKYLLWRDINTLSLVDLTMKTMTVFSNIKYETSQYLKQQII